LWSPGSAEHCDDARLAGADDFVMLPLRPDEIIARTTALVRRGTSWHPTLSIGPLLVDSAEQQVNLGEASIDLRGLAYRALAYVVKHHERVVELDEIARQVGGHVRPTAPALRQARRWLADAAKALGSCASNPIERLAGVGVRVR
jgi:DNA-binding response OmpR family regulator